MKYGVLNWWKNFLFFGIRLYEGDGSGGGGDGSGDKGGGDKTFTKADVDAAISSAVESAVGGLKTKNSELLEKINKTTDRLKAYGDVTPEKIQEMIQKLENEDDADLLKNGKIDELVAKKADKINADWESKYGEILSERDAEREGRTAAEQRYNDRVVSQEVMKAAIEAGVRKEAIDDVLAQARTLFIVGDDDELESRDKDGNLRKIGDKLLTPEHWLDSLKESKPHYWPDSAGVGAKGNKGDKGGKSGDLSARIQDAAAAGDMAEYRRLRKKKAEGS